ncbi:MAG: diaminopimelate epimerase [Dermatophilus congolensis]|nr:diaminopimelate epimerase [Dermatophilus congolensis]
MSEPTTPQTTSAFDEKPRRAFTKGHGTQNDFVLVPDLDGTDDLDIAAVRRLADRRAGIGGDGVIRVVPTELSGEPDIAALADRAHWFMDYRNADGSLAQMCGNGTRVFAAYLRREGLETADTFDIATRAGVKHITVDGELYATGMGPYRLPEESAFRERGSDAIVEVRGIDGVSDLPGLSVNMGNPHTVVALPPDADLTALDLTVLPRVAPEPPEGTNVEYVQILGNGHLQMRVYERGVGETRSCGTGAAAAAVAAMLWSGDAGDNSQWRVDVPGGTLQVTVGIGQEVTLAGPAALVADGVTDL